MRNQTRRGVYPKKKLQHNAVYLLHKAGKMLHIDFCLNNWLYQAENLGIGAVLHDISI